jgi:antitoxin component HigA of HigAB toxin-antitoxin module
MRYRRHFKILKTNTDYEQALNRLDEIFDAKPNTPILES